MTKILKSAEVTPDVLSAYEREAFEENLRGDTDAGAEKPLTREAILAQAREDAAQKVEAAYAEGLQRGTAAGKEQFDASIAQCAEALGAAAEAMKEAHATFLDSLEPDVVDLVQRIATTVVLQEAQSDPELIRATARRALRVLLDREKLLVKVNPADLEALRAHKVALLEEFDGITRLDIQPDASISPGGCTIESELMHVDARIEAQLDRIFEAMRTGPESGPATPGGPGNRDED